MHTIHKDIKNLKYVKSIKMYQKLTQIHLNYKFKNALFVLVLGWSVPLLCKVFGG